VRTLAHWFKNRWGIGTLSAATRVVKISNFLDRATNNIIPKPFERTGKKIHSIPISNFFYTYNICPNSLCAPHSD
jgi:hypothetical protein